MLSNGRKPAFTTKEIATIGIMAAMLEAVKIILQPIPNVELVTLFIILFTLYLGPKTFVAIWAFVGLECVVYGFGLWTVMYIYIWPILALLTLLFRHEDSKWPFVILSTLFGMAFGALCSIPYFFIGGIYTAVTWWVAGIPYDILHGLANFVIAFVLFDPLNKLLRRLKLSF